MLRIHSKSFWLLLIIIILGVWFFKFAKHYPRDITLDAKPDFWGLTFSPKFATSLGLDWQETYIAILDELEADKIRIPIYWDQIEEVEGQYDFSDYDYIFNEGAARGVDFIANVGWRLPRWPECHQPAWSTTLSNEARQKEIINMLGVVVKRYKGHPAIVAWQVENEPLLDSFGLCPDGDLDFLQKEVAFVRSLDDKQIIISASGELSSWRQEAKIADIFATTMYRVVWNPILGYLRYPIPTVFYDIKARQQNIDKSKAIVSELQTEPWVPNGTLADLDFDEFAKSFDIEQFRANLQFAINADFAQTYLWGVEWWYLQHQNGNSQYWALAQSLFANN